LIVVYPSNYCPVKFQINAEKAPLFGATMMT